MNSEKTTITKPNSNPKITRGGLVFLKKENYLELKQTADAVRNARIQIGDNHGISFVNGEMVIVIPKNKSETANGTGSTTGSSQQDATGGTGGTGGNSDPSTPSNPNGTADDFTNDNGSANVPVVGGGTYQKNDDGSSTPVDVTYDSDGNQYIDGYATHQGVYGEAEFTWTLTAGFPEYEPWVMVYDGGSIRYEKSIVVDTPTGPARSTVKGVITLTTNGYATLFLQCTGDSRLAGHFWHAYGVNGPSPDLAATWGYGFAYGGVPICSVSAAGGSAMFDIFIGLLGDFCAHNIDYDSTTQVFLPNLVNACVGSRYHPGSCYGRTLLKYYNDTQLGNKKLRVTNFTSAKHDHLATIKLLTWEGKVLATVKNVNLKTRTPTDYTVDASMAKIEQCWIAEFATSDHTTPTLTITSEGYNMWHKYDEYKIRVIESRLFTTVKKLGSNQANVGNGGVTTVTTGQTQLTDDSS